MCTNICYKSTTHIYMRVHYKRPENAHTHCSGPYEQLTAHFQTAAHRSRHSHRQPLCLNTTRCKQQHVANCRQQPSYASPQLKTLQQRQMQLLSSGKVRTACVASERQLPATFHNKQQVRLNPTATNLVYKTGHPARPSLEHSQTTQLQTSW